MFVMDKEGIEDFATDRLLDCICPSVLFQGQEASHWPYGRPVKATAVRSDALQQGDHSLATKADHGRGWEHTTDTQ